MSAPGARTNSIVLVGPLPPPHGGVSTFIERLTLAVPEVVRMILDTGEGSPGPAGRRDESSVDVRTLPPSLLRSWAAQRRHLHDVGRDATVIVNVSHPQGVLRYLPAFRHDARTAVVLHHGTPLRRRGPAGGIVERLTRWVLVSRADVVVCLNEAQARFVRDAYGVPAASIRFASSYVPVDLVIDVTERLARPSDRLRVVASGEPRAYHHFDQLVDVWEAGGFGGVAELIVCLYGPEDAALEAALAAAAREAQGVCLRRDLDGWEFLDVLRASDVYVRTSSVDAFGIAVADAVRLGLEVVATDVCERYPGCRLIPPGDPAALENALRDAIRDRQSTAAPPVREDRPDAMEVSVLDALGIAYQDLTSGREDRTK